MSNLSRRSFFSQFSHDLSDQFDLKSIKVLAASVAATPLSQQDENQWIEIARLAELSPHSILKKCIGNVILILHADEEGIWANRINGTRVALRTGTGGSLWVNLASSWPDHRFLSHATGEPTNKEINHE